MKHSSIDTCSVVCITTFPENIITIHTSRQPAARKKAVFENGVLKKLRYTNTITRYMYLQYNKREMLNN